MSTFSPAGIEQFFQEAGEPVEDRSAPPPPVTEATIARFIAAEASGWKDHHETLPPPVTEEKTEPGQGIGEIELFTALTKEV